MRIIANLRKLQERAEGFIEKHYRLAVGVICLVYLATRLYRLVDIPVGMNFDEIGIAYDAFSLSLDHIDRYQYKMPFYLINFGGGQSIMYTYITMILCMIFDYSKFILRLPAVICGLVLTISSYLIGYELFGSRKSAVFTSFLFMICPVLFMSQRWALDSPLMMPFFAVSFYFFLRAVKTEKMCWYILSGIGMGLTLYNYALSYVIIPMFLLLTIIYLWRVGRLRWSNMIVMFIPIVIFAVPLVLMLAINRGYIPEIRATYFSIPKLPMYREGEMTLKNIPDNWYMIKNLFCYDWLYYSALPEFGTMYYISIPFALYGLGLTIRDTYISIKKKNLDLWGLIFFVFLCPFCVMMILDTPTISRAYFIYFSLLMFVVIGIRTVYRKFQHSIVWIGGIYLIGFICFCSFYFNVYPIKYASQLNFFQCDLGEAIEYYDANYDTGTQLVYIDESNSVSADLQLLLYTRSPIESYNRSEKMMNNYHLYLPETIDESAWYLIHIQNEEMKERLKAAGLKSVDVYHNIELWK